VFLLALTLAAGPCGGAAALTLKNLDPEERKIVVIENDKRSEVVLKPNEVLKGACKAACDIETADGTLYDFDGDEAVVIEEGLLVIDGDEQPPPAR
jgi:xanthine/CO dehydrogenase XdhC/CoxF family maturation factor